jgi:hypothetical protein
VSSFATSTHCLNIRLEKAAKAVFHHLHDNPAHAVVSSERTILFLPPERELFAQADGFEYVLWNVLGCIVLPNPPPNCATLSRATYDKRSAAVLGNSRAMKKPFPGAPRRRRVISHFV